MKVLLKDFDYLNMGESIPLFKMVQEENKQEVEEQKEEEIVEEAVDKVEEGKETVSEAEKEIAEEIAEEVEQEVKEPEKKKRDKDNLHEEIEIPGDITANIEDDVLIIKKDDKEIRRKLIALIDVKIKENKIVLKAERNRKIEKRLFGTFRAHINNMIKGLNEDFVYKLKIANVHFPMNVSYNDNNQELIIKNFLGEKKDRIIKLSDRVDVKVDNEDIIVTSYDIEKAGDAATKIEKGAKVRNKDRRIFQDGIFLISKPNKEFM